MQGDVCFARDLLGESKEIGCFCRIAKPSDFFDPTASGPPSSAPRAARPRRRSLALTSPCSDHLWPISALRDRTLEPLTVPSRSFFPFRRPFSLRDRMLEHLTVPSRGVFPFRRLFPLRDRMLEPLTVPSRKCWWRRSCFSAGTCATVERIKGFCGAGPQTFFGPAPK